MAAIASVGDPDYQSQSGAAFTTDRDRRTPSSIKNRDLNPTIDLRGVLKGVLAEHFEAPAGLLATTVFPDSAAVAPYKGLVAV